jgi:hypothetical protein
MSQVRGSQVRAGTGLSRSADAFEAGRASAVAALAPLAGEPPELVLVFCTPRYDLPRLLAGVRSATGGALLIGCTGSGELVGGQHLGFGGGVGVLAMTAGPYRFGVASAADLEGLLDEAGQSLARASRAQAGSSPHAAALLLTDSLLGDLQQFVQGVYRVTGPQVAIVGGAAGDEQRFVASSLFHGDAVLRKGALVLWIASDRPLRVVTRHGWEPSGPLQIVTRAEGTEILELGGRAAAAVYREQLGLPDDLSPEAFWACAVQRPFGLLQPDGSHVIRTARAATPRGGLTIQGCVPQVGSAVQIMRGDCEALLGVIDEVVGAALSDRADAAVLLTFSCAARALVLRDRAQEEAARLQAAAGGVPAFGFHCCGEFARTSGVLATHNATLTAVAL